MVLKRGEMVHVHKSAALSSGIIMSRPSMQTINGMSAGFTLVRMLSHNQKERAPH